MPKLLWREPIETTVITRARDDDAAKAPTSNGSDGNGSNGNVSAVTKGSAAGSSPTAAEQPRPRVRVKTLGDIAGRESGALIVLLVAIGALALASPEFLSGNNLANLARQVAIFGILAIGQLFVILTGGIDLSVGSILGLAGAVTAQLLVAGMPIIPSIFLGAVVGGILGLAEAPASAWSTTFEVADTDATLAKVFAAGGSSATPEDTPYGRSATITDPFGHEFSVIARPPLA